MSPGEFVRNLKSGKLAPAYLFAGPDAYYLEICRRALVDCLLPPEEREAGLIRHDLDEVSLAEVMDDARAYSLFAPRRLLWVASAESALPRGRALAAEPAEGAPSRDSGADTLAAYLADPPADTVVVFQATRYAFEGEDKARMDRVLKFYSPVRAVVEFRPFTPQAARTLAVDLAKKAGLKLSPEDIELLVEALGADAARIATEVEKLRLFVGPEGRVRREDISALVPDARATTIFALVNALGRKDRVAALETLDTLVREGEYLPLSLAFLGTQFRLALAAREAGLRSPQQVQSHFTQMGMPMWRARAEQVAATAAVFDTAKLEAAIRTVSRADVALRDTRPDDRVVMEEFILKLTA